MIHSFFHTLGFAVAIIAMCLAPRLAGAQNAARATVQVTVSDPSGAIVQDATVTLAGLDPATKATVVAPLKTTDKGVAIFQGIAPGLYTISAQFPGFDMGVLQNVAVRSGTSRHAVTLPLRTLQETVTATDAQADAADRRASDFGLVLSDNQIQALSDDPTELARQIAELGGPDAIVRVDSFEGQQLPPKAQIKSVRVSRDQFAAEMANPGSTVVDIVTQPGVGAIRGSTTFSFREDAMNGLSQFSPTRQDEQINNYGGNIGGTIVREKTSFSVSVNGQSQYITPTLNATLPDGVRAETLRLRQSTSFQNVNILVDHAVTRDQTLRVGLNLSENDARNLGVGNYDLPERAWSRGQRNRTLRLQETGPIGRRTFINARLSYGWLGFEHRSVSDARTIVVSDAFTSGGAQQYWDVRAKTMNVAADIDHVRGIHAWRGGFQIDGLWFNSLNQPNLNGTLSFSSLDAYDAGQPAVFTQSLGAATVKYTNLQGAAYIQDDIRVRRGLTMSPGLRYSLQKRIDDRTAFEPRFGMTWAPSARGTTSIRGSVGVFHGWLPPELIEQTLRMNGENQREIVIIDAEELRAIYQDDAVASGDVRPSSRYIIEDGFDMQRNVRYSAGVDQVLSTRMRMNVLYNYIHLQQQPRGRNLNAPVDGVRPDPTVANVIESVTDAEIRRHEVYINATVAVAPPSPELQRPFFNWRRLSLNAGYTLIRARNNSSGPWTVPPSDDISNDWGPGPQDAPYRVQLLLTSTQIRNLNANVTYVANSGGPYNWTTGFDNNRDGFLNDRPAGVGLRTLRGAPQQTLNMRIAYSLVLAKAADVPAAQARYRVQIFANIQNLTNHQNLGGYSGVETSPNFRQPTLVVNPRKVDFGLTINF